MTAREKMEAAFSQSGTPEIPAVICYEGIYVRDHWEQLTRCPWWYQFAPDIERQLEWRRDVIERTGMDWSWLPALGSRSERANVSIESRPAGVFALDRRTGGERQLSEPPVAGWIPSKGLHSHHPDHLADTREKVDQCIPVEGEPDAKEGVADGRDDLARALLGGPAADLYPICHVSTPLWNCYSLWGFEGMMTMVAERPDLVEYACSRFLTLRKRAVRFAAGLGAAGIWLEECMTDMISADAFGSLNVPPVRELVREVQAAGMHAIYYYCGDPTGKWPHLFAVGADALSLEESKKGFEIDIEEAVDRAQGRCTVLGNLDAIGLLEHGADDELRVEISRQIAAGRRNGSRFIMSLGSPVTPGTPVDRVRLYCDLVHELGG